MKGKGKVMEIIGFEKDEKVLAKAEKSGGRVIRTIVSEIVVLILFGAIINPFIFRWMASQYSISYESWDDLIVSAITAKAADYLFGVFLIIENVVLFLQAVISIILALIRHSRRELYLTDRRIFGHTGNLLIGKKNFNLQLSQIAKIGVRKNGLTQLFRYEIVEINSSLGQFWVDGIGNSRDFVAIYQKFRLKETHSELEREYLEQLEQEKGREKNRTSLQELSGAFPVSRRNITYKTTWQCSCGRYNPMDSEKCTVCGKAAFQSHEERRRKIAKEYRSVVAENGSFYHALTGEPILEKRERYYIISAAILYMLSVIFSLNAYYSGTEIEAAFAELESILPPPFSFLPFWGMLLGVILTVFLAAMAVKKKYWALCTLKVGMIFGTVVNVISFIVRLPTLTVPESWLFSPIGIGVLLGFIFNLFIGVMVIKGELWAFRIMQILLILGLIVNGIAFIGALPTLKASTCFGLIGYKVVTFCLINTGSAALSEMVQSSRKRPKAQPKQSTNR